MPKPGQSAATDCDLIAFENGYGSECEPRVRSSLHQSFEVDAPLMTTTIDLCCVVLEAVCFSAPALRGPANE